MSDGKTYDEDYFLHGKESGKSLYENYRWMPELTVPMVQRIAEHCGITKGAPVLDYGCARGYVVKALRGLGYNAYGTDISEWAIKNADEEAKPYLWKLSEDNSPVTAIRLGPTAIFDWVIAKDVLEHVEYVQNVVNALMDLAQVGLFVVVPTTKFIGGKYIIEEYEKDITHIQRYPAVTWVKMFLRAGWEVHATFRMPGVKDNYYKHGWEEGNAFITARRIAQP